MFICKWYEPWKVESTWECSVRVLLQMLSSFQQLKNFDNQLSFHKVLSTMKLEAFCSTKPSRANCTVCLNCVCVSVNHKFQLSDTETYNHACSDILTNPYCKPETWTR